MTDAVHVVCYYLLTKIVVDVNVCHTLYYYDVHSTNSYISAKALTLLRNHDNDVMWNKWAEFATICSVIRFCFHIINTTIKAPNR